ncbi:MAG: metal ABC transporter solute-binding protein, Zn/Mn family [Thermaurantimonas sp.]
MKIIRPIFLLYVATFIFSCGSKSPELRDKPTVVCTTTMIYDAISQIFDSTINVSTLIKAGVDPHTYKATAGDLKKIKNADVVIYNGLHLEGKFSEILDELHRRGKAIPVARYVKKENLIFTSENVPDPHIWFEIPLWQLAIRHTIDEMLNRFKERLTSEQFEFIQQNAEKYFLELTEVHHEALRLLGVIPSEQRVVITAHDAFNYFGRTYSIEVIGLQGISTASEHGLKDIIDMIHLIVKRRIPAIFVETTVSEKTVRAVIEGCASKNHFIRLGGMLYSDALGPESSGHHTLAGAFRHNVYQIYNSLNQAP